MENFEDIVKAQQRYEFLKSHPETKVYPFQLSDTEEIDTKFSFYKIKRKWKKIKRILYIIVAVLLFLNFLILEIAWDWAGMFQ